MAGNVREIEEGRKKRKKRKERQEKVKRKSVTREIEKKKKEIKWLREIYS